MHILGHYILDDQGNPKPEPDPAVWFRWFADTANRRVAFTVTANVEISTVFLGLDHNFEEMWRRDAEFEDISEDYGQLNKPLPKDYVPVLWETMVFGINLVDGIQLRYKSQEDALTGHEVVVAEVERALRERYEAKHKI